MSVILLIAFPMILLAMVWAFIAALNYFGNTDYNAYGEPVHWMDKDAVNYAFIQTMPWVVGGVAIWFLIAYFSNASMVKAATGARTLERRENPRVYNIVENLTMACGMDMPKINVVDDPQLNAFASGIDKKSYTVTVTTGLLNLLNDDTENLLLILLCFGQEKKTGAVASFLRHRDSLQQDEFVGNL